MITVRDKKKGKKKGERRGKRGEEKGGGGIKKTRRIEIVGPKNTLIKKVTRNRRSTEDRTMRTALFGSSSSSSGLSSLPDHGTSTASANNNQRVKDLFNKWLQTEAPKQQYGGKTWEQLPEATLCRREIHAEFGHFLVHEYIIVWRCTSTSHPTGSLS